MITEHNVKDLFDYRDGKLFWKKSGKKAGSLSSQGYLRTCYKGFRTANHRIVWLWHNGEWPSMDLDHINRNRSDNRIENLRVVTRAENQKNQGRGWSNTKSLGITYRPKREKFEVTYCGKYVGLFATKQDALAARGLAEFLDPQHLRTAL